MTEARRPDRQDTETSKADSGELMFTGPWACLAGAVLFVVIGACWYLADAPPGSRLLGPWAGLAVAIAGSVLMVYEFFRKRRPGRGPSGWRVEGSQE